MCLVEDFMPDIQDDKGNGADIRNEEVRDVKLRNPCGEALGQDD